MLLERGTSAVLSVDLLRACVASRKPRKALLGGALVRSWSHSSIVQWGSQGVVDFIRPPHSINWSPKDPAWRDWAWCNTRNEERGERARGSETERGRESARESERVREREI